MDWAALDAALYKMGNRTFTGTVDIPAGTQVSAEEFGGLFVRAGAFDLWQLDPNQQIESDSYWKLSSDGKFFVKLYENSAPVPHDHRWAVYPSGDNEKISISYKQDPVLTIEISKLGLNKSDIVGAQKALLKMLSTKSGVQDLLSILPSNEREGFVMRHSELGD